MLEKYVQLLKDHSLKITPQRLQILHYLDTHRTHPDAKEIYSSLKQKTPSLSKTTVYNALEILKKNYIIQAVTISGSKARYDFKSCLHHHFLCTNCGAIIDIDMKCPNLKKVETQGYQINEVHGYFKGLCTSCQKKKRGNEQ